jgi:hypothetical protein
MHFENTFAGPCACGWICKSAACRICRGICGFSALSQLCTLPAICNIFLFTLRFCWRIQNEKFQLHPRVSVYWFMRKNKELLLKFLLKTELISNLFCFKICASTLRYHEFSKVNQWFRSNVSLKVISIAFFIACMQQAPIIPYGYMQSNRLHKSIKTSSGKPIRFGCIGGHVSIVIECRSTSNWIFPRFTNPFPL